MSNAQRLPQGLVVSEIPDIDPSSIVDIRSSEKGLLIPRMTTAEREAIASPATGLMVYDNTLNDFYYFDGTEWVALADSNKFIPLAGTDLGNPVTGNIEFSDSASTGMYSENEFMRRQILFSDEQDMLIKSDTFASSYGEFHVRSSSTESVVNDGTYTSNLFVGTDGVNVSATNPASKGIIGGQDFSPNYDPLTYVQEKYVVPINGTRVDNPITGALTSDYTGGKALRSNVSTQFYAPGAESDEFSIYNASGFGINQDPDGNSFNSVFPNFTGESGLSVLWRHPNAAGDYNYASEQYVDSAISAIGGSFVPYSGATETVDLGNQTLSAGNVNTNQVFILEDGESFGAFLNTQLGLSSHSFSKLPQADGILVNSVNGELADVNGNVDLIINLASSVSGTLPVANGGTGLSAVGSAFQSLTVNSTTNANVYANRYRDGIENTTDASSINTLSEQIIFSTLMPGNTFSGNSLVDLDTFLTRVGSGGNATIKYYLNDTNDLVTPLQIAQLTSATTALNNGLHRTFKVTGTVIEGFSGNTGANNDVMGSAGTPLSGAFVVGNPYYLIVTVTLNISTDVFTQKYIRLRTNK